MKRFFAVAFLPAVLPCFDSSVSSYSDLKCPVAHQPIIFKHCDLDTPLCQQAPARVRLF